MYTGSVNRDYKFLDGQDIVPVQLVAFSLATKFCLRICRRYLRYLGFLPNFCPAICLFAFTLEIFTVLVSKTLVQRNYFHEFLVTDCTLSIADRKTLPVSQRIWTPRGSGPPVQIPADLDPPVHIR